MGRPPLEKKQRQFAVALPPDVRGQLETAAAKAGHSIAEEVRRRITLTFEEEALDGPTKELREQIVRLADKLRVDLDRNWHASPGVHREFAAGIADLVAEYLPPERTGPSGPSDLFAGNILGPEDSAGTLGRARARDVRREHSYPHLEAAQKRRAPRLFRWAKPKGEKP